MRKRLLIILLPLLLVIAIVIALSYSPVRDITSAPRASVEAIANLREQDSIVALPVSIAYTDLQRFANEKIPAELVNKRERKRYKKRFIGVPIEIEGRLDTLVRRRAEVQVGRQGDALKVMVPLAFEARFRGKDRLDPDASTKGAVNVVLTLKFDISPEWQPTLDVKTRYHWVRKPRLKVGLLRLDASDMLGDELEKRLRKLARELEKDVRESAKLQERAAEYWYEFHQLRQLGEDDTPAWLMVDPKAAYFAPPRFTDDALHLEFALAVKLSTILGKVLPPPVAEPLPALINSAPPANGFRIQLPVLLDYAGILQALRQRYLNHSLELTQGRVTFLDFKLYTSGETLVVGAEIDASAPGRLLNTRGWLYLQGKPLFDEENRQLRIDNIHFTRQVNNPLISSASWVLQDSLREQLADALSVDLGEHIDDAKAEAHERLNRPLGEGLVMTGQLDTLTVSSIQPRKNDLLLLLDAGGHVAISSQLAAAVPQAE